MQAQRWILLSILFFTLPVLHAGEVLTQHKGLTLNAQLALAAGKSFDDGVVLIVHGFLAHKRMEVISTAQQSLLDSGYSSLAINLGLGIDNRQGFHGCDRPHRHVQDDAVNEISAWVAWLRSKGASEITLMGHSSGANQALVYSIDALDPEVKRLVLLASGTAGTRYSRDQYEQRFNVEFKQFIASLEKALAEGNGDALMTIDWNSCPRADTTPRSFLSYYSYDNRFARFKENLGRTRIPVLVILGSLDELQPNKAEILSAVGDRNSVRVMMIEGADHFFRDFNIDEAMEALIEFIGD